MGVEAVRRATSELVSGYSHAIAVFLSVAGLAILVVGAMRDATAWHVVGFVTFGSTLILLYTASALYHLVPLPEDRKTAFRRIDHIMIYVLIAGTYTPVCLTTLRGAWGWSLLAAIWTLALLGLAFKLAWFEAPRWLSTTLYVLMGWAVLVALAPLWDAVGRPGVLWLLVGGLWYTAGAAAYATEWPTLHPRHFTYHELFHILVMLGSLTHLWFMYRFVLVPAQAGP